jgi:hypothetical protein
MVPKILIQKEMTLVPCKILTFMINKIRKLSMVQNTDKLFRAMPLVFLEGTLPWICMKTLLGKLLIISLRIIGRTSSAVLRG